MADKKLQCVIVTPERAVLDEPADMVILPMIDGELGVLPRRAALVGRLGNGELRIKNGPDTKRLRVEGGFVQVRSDVVTVLTTKVVG
jgi:F-type H+-transporting ATPase subunit epsilon